MRKTLLITLLAASFSAVAAPVNSEDAAFTAALAALEKHQLTSLKTECLFFDAAEEGDNYQINVHEKHDASCGGDPNTAPRLFTLTVAKADGKVSVDDPVSGETRVLE
ncbi:hypothetical protein CHUV0807_1698 [Cardiobacterium hominis]|uniref:Uncharacterized protein n=1 Tax=Cardiobacterium hominis TaxID=2718 RepID=A0A1C3H5B8_9GAMM|nr:hypothetical protein [Cardiobacterium hominis]SAM67030.1 hypothetical protein CHUV0807_1698 [Cardiobacterium hominis]